MGDAACYTGRRFPGVSPNEECLAGVRPNTGRLLTWGPARVRRRLAASLRAKDGQVDYQLPRLSGGPYRRCRFPPWGRGDSSTRPNPEARDALQRAGLRGKVLVALTVGRWGPRLPTFVEIRYTDFWNTSPRRRTTSPPRLLHPSGP